MYSSILIFSFVIVVNLSLCSASTKRNFMQPLDSNKIPLYDGYNTFNGNNDNRNQFFKTDGIPSAYNDYRGAPETQKLWTRFGYEPTLPAYQNPKPMREDTLTQSPSTNVEYNGYRNHQQRPDYTGMQPSTSSELRDQVRRLLNLSQQLLEIVTQLLSEHSRLSQV